MLEYKSRYSLRRIFGISEVCLSKKYNFFSRSQNSFWNFYASACIAISTDTAHIKYFCHVTLYCVPKKISYYVTTANDHLQLINDKANFCRVYKKLPIKLSLESSRYTNDQTHTILMIDTIKYCLKPDPWWMVYFRQPF